MNKRNRTLDQLTFLIELACQLIDGYPQEKKKGRPASFKAKECIVPDNVSLASVVSKMVFNCRTFRKCSRKEQEDPLQFRQVGIPSVFHFFIAVHIKKTQMESTIYPQPPGVLAVAKETRSRRELWSQLSRRVAEICLTKLLTTFQSFSLAERRFSAAKNLITKKKGNRDYKRVLGEICGGYSQTLRWT
ncbi:hypothetical protein TNCV_2071241 [Trichonephila clavipes]|uniref:Uncharacterized protein n=1 Tax=Trichonephila clavipes TaxID=2585209 RepID=A0A8X6W3L1_TRICX|nr:hypothetical protein TNCV_2071241 [Trichonephila clavipes]